MRAPSLRNTLLGLALGCLGGCGILKDIYNDAFGDDENADGALDLETGALLDDGGVQDVPPDVPAQAPPPPRQPLTRSTRKYPFPAKGGSNMGFRVDTLAKAYALEGEAEAPPWSASHEGDPARTRDDDLDTAWTCTPKGEERCAVGIHFPYKATLKGIRLFAAAGPSTELYESFPRPRRLRIHTDEGFLDALLPDDNGHVYAVFGKEIVTQNLTLEVVEIWKGKSPIIHVAEIEVYGTVGTPRAELEIDPARSYVRIEEPVWRKGGRDTFDRRPSFIYVVDDKGVSHRFASGTALRGRGGDRLVLIERLQSVTACDAPRGTYYLLDTKTRLVAPLGELGGVGGDAFAARDGSGIAVGYSSDLRTILDGLFASEGKYHRKRTPVREDKRADDYVEKWGLQRLPLQRAALPLAKAPTCEVATAAHVEELAAARAAVAAATKAKKRKRRGPPPEPTPPEQWHVCDLGLGARAFMSDHGPCGGRWEIHVLNAAGAVVDSVEEPARGSHLGVRDLSRADDPASTLLVEVADETDAVSLLTVTADGIELFADSAAVALNPPSKCRDICNAGFVNPHAPTWQ